jgi:hypothetical protein
MDLNIEILARVRAANKAAGFFANQIAAPNGNDKPLRALLR